MWLCSKKGSWRARPVGCVPLLQALTRSSSQAQWTGFILCIAEHLLHPFPSEPRSRVLHCSSGTAQTRSAMAQRSPLPSVAPVRVMVGIAHDENLVRKGFRSALQEAGMEVAIAVDTLADLEVGLRSLPDVRVLVVQLHLPVKQMTEDLERLMRRSKLPVIVIGALNGPVVETLVQLDVKGVLTNKVLDPELVTAVQVVAQGGIHANNWMLDQLKHKRKRTTLDEERSNVKLTAKLEQTAQLLFDHPELGMPALAALANLNKRTLESRAKALYDKMNLANRNAFMKYKGLHR